MKIILTEDEAVYYILKALDLLDGVKLAMHNSGAAVMTSCPHDVIIKRKGDADGQT